MITPRSLDLSIGSEPGQWAAQSISIVDFHKYPATNEALPQGPIQASKVHSYGRVTLWLTGLTFTAIHVAFSGRFGFHRDELLSYTNAMHLDWCYVVYPPLTAWLARAELVAFGNILVGYRFLPAVAVGLVSVLAGLIARAMGGGLRSAMVAAVAAGIAGPICFAGSFLSYMSFDLLWWVLVAWATARLLETEDARWWITIGACMGLGLLTKYTIVFFAVSLLGGMLLTSNRRYFRSGWFWCGVGLALVMTLPVIVWQFHHHFVALAWMRSIHARDVSMGRANYFIFRQFWNTTNPSTVPIWCAGLWFLIVAPAGNPFRMLGWMYAITLTLFVVARGREYYIAPAYPMLMAAGTVWGESWLLDRSPRAQKIVKRVARNSFIFGALAVFALTLPIAPIQSTWWRLADASTDHQSFSMELGWPELVSTVAKVRDSLPVEDRSEVGVLAADDGEAGAVNMYGRAYGLPEAISGMNSNWLRGYGTPPPQTVIAVGFKREDVQKIFAACKTAAQLSNPYGIVNQNIGSNEVYVCRDIRVPWPEFWKGFQYYG